MDNPKRIVGRLSNVLCPQIVAGGQLSIERAVNVMSSVPYSPPTQSISTYYYMTWIVRAFWLAHARAIFCHLRPITMTTVRKSYSRAPVCWHFSRREIWFFWTEFENNYTRSKQRKIKNDEEEYFSSEFYYSDEFELRKTCMKTPHPKRSSNSEPRSCCFNSCLLKSRRRNHNTKNKV